MPRQPFAKLRLTTLAALGAVVLIAPPIRADEAKTTFNIPAQDLSTALREFARQSSREILFSSEVAQGKKTKGVKGDLTADAALTKLLAGTGLVVAKSANGTTLVTTPDAKEASGKSGPPIAPSGATNNPQQGSRTNEAGPGRTALLEEVLVTGSRIPLTTLEGPQAINAYTKEQIDRSGQTTLGGFLNSLPDVPVSVNENAFQTFAGGTTLQLHGLPLGTTLVLLNGRRVETSGAEAGFNFFDLNNIPLAAVERIEVLGAGSSAIYGSDAIAGVVNIILKQNFSGLEASAKYGSANRTDESNASVAFGRKWDRGSVSLVGSFQTRSDLEGFERSITGNNNYTQFGGIDARASGCNPGNVRTLDGSNLPGVGAPNAAVPVGFTGTPTQQEFAGTAGVTNKCSNTGYYSYIPEARRAGLLATADYKVTSGFTLFTEQLYSHSQQVTGAPPPGLSGTVSASNPFNPFGEAVHVSSRFTTLGRTFATLNTDFLRSLVGAKGELPNDWHWEIAAWDAQDSSHYSISNTTYNSGGAIRAALSSSDPATALNPFVDGAQGSQALLNSFVYDEKNKYLGQTLAANAFIRGPIVKTPAGPIDLVLGSEYNRDKLYTDLINLVPFYPPNTATTFRRSSYAAFGEVRIPILANHANSGAGPILAVNVAGRYDHYSDFGNKTTPQFGAEWRPLETLLIRGTYSEAFKAPSLNDLHSTSSVFQTQVVDPLSNNQVENINATYGGNPNLHPETGNSRTLGVAYLSKRIPNLQASVSQWTINENGSIQGLDVQTIVNNESLFPGVVIRAPGQNGQAGPITQVNATTVNFGATQVSGVDFHVAYKFETSIGNWEGSLSATDTYHYTAALQPATPATNRAGIANDDGNWAPRWKGTVALGWQSGSYSVAILGRYVGRYVDYDTTSEIGNFWLYDTNLRYSLGNVVAPSNGWLRSLYIEAGGVNLFNTLPQYSNYNFGGVGYDVAEGDIRGRFLYARIGVKL